MEDGCTVRSFAKQPHVCVVSNTCTSKAEEFFMFNCEKLRFLHLKFSVVAIADKFR